MFTNAQVKLVDVQVRDGNGDPAGLASRPPYLVMITPAAMTAGLNPYVFTPGSVDDGWAGQETIYLLFDTEDEMRAALAEHLDGWGKELVDIENDSNWSFFETDVSFIGGKMAINEMEGDTDSAATALSTPLSAHVAVLTVLEITDYTDGMVCVVVGGIEGTWRSAAGTYEEIITPGSGSSNDVRLSYAGNTTLCVARLSARARIVEAPAETLGPELSQEPPFTSSGWTFVDYDFSGNEPTITNGKIAFNPAAPDAAASRTAAATLDNGKTYRVELVIDSISSGHLLIYFGDVEVATLTTPGTFVLTTTGTSSQVLQMMGVTACDAVVSKFSVREML